MTLAEVRDLLQAEVLWADDLQKSLTSGAAADLMSDVLALGGPGVLLLTALASTHAIRTASITDMGAVVFVRGKQPLPEVVENAREAGIPVLATHLEMYEAAGLLQGSLPAARPSPVVQSHGD